MHHLFQVLLRLKLGIPYLETACLTSLNRNREGVNLPYMQTEDNLDVFGVVPTSTQIAGSVIREKESYGFPPISQTIMGM